MAGHMGSVGISSGNPFNAIVISCTEYLPAGGPAITELLRVDQGHRILEGR